MRVSLLNLIIALCSMQVLMARDAAGQGLDDINVTVELNNGDIKTLFKKIETQTTLRFAYDPMLVQAYTDIFLPRETRSIRATLDLALEGTPLRYLQSDNSVIIYRESGQANSKSIPQDANLAITVSGTIRDSDNTSLPGVNIIEKGTTNGTTSDAEGRYLLAVSDENAVLIFSFIGFITKEVALNGSSVVDVVMEGEVTTLDEVVVVGYGTQKQRDLSGGVSTYSPSNLTARPVTSPDQMLQGRMAGVSVSSGSGTPGGAIKVSVRGIGSLSASNDPLYVIDGVPVTSVDAALFDFGESMNPLASLNPNDIESISVLKDAGAAAIYGSRATNGVVIITTKSGKKGNPKLNVDVYSGLQWIPNLDKIKMAGSELYVSVLNEAFDNYNKQHKYNVGDANYEKPIENPYPGLHDVNWVDLVLRTAHSTNANLSFSGGSDEGTYYISGSYLDQEGAVMTNRLRRYTGRINLTKNIFSWLKLGANTTFSSSRNNRVPGSSIGSKIMGRALEQRTFDRPYKPDGSYYVGGTAELMRHNPIQILNEEKAHLDESRLLGDFYSEILFLKNFRFKSSLGADVMFTHDYVYYNQNHPYSTGNGRIVDERRTISNVLYENTLDYTKQFRQVNMNILIGHSFQRVTSTHASIDGRGFPSPSFDVISVASDIADASTDLSESALESYFGRASLSWNDRYLLMVSMRADGSSKFSPKDRFGYFPAASLAWVASKEEFWSMSRTRLKLRMSYGETGNQQSIGDYAYQALASGGYNYMNNSGIAVSTYGNNTLTWEKANQFDIGIDLGLLDEVVNVSLDFFEKNTTNLLYDMPIQATSGFTSITSNIGSMRNRGLEVGINTDMNLGPVQWNSNFNIAFIRNELTSLIGDDVTPVGGDRALKVGYPVGSFWLYKMLGIYQNDEEVPAPLFEDDVRAGDIRYEDLNGDDYINVDDLQMIGSSNPKFFGGWNNTFQYKGFDLSLLLTYSYGNDIYASWRDVVSRLGNGTYAFLNDVALNRWTGPGTSNTVPRAISGTGYNGKSSTRWLEDGSYLRLRTLSLGYNFPHTSIARIGLQNLRVYVQGDNLYLLTRYSGLDPEVSNSQDPRFMGNDNSVFPQLRVLNVGMNITF